MKKESFKLYTNDLTIKRAILTINKKEYRFNDLGYIEIELKPKTYIMNILNQELIYYISNPNRIYFIYREDNDCHFNILIKDVSLEEVK